MKYALVGAMLMLAQAGAHANPFGVIESQPRGELWVNPGFYSYHFDRGEGLDDTNPGIGAEYRFSTVASATAGRFRNSDRAISNYAGIYYQPFSLGPFRLGAVVGAFDGYPKHRDGGWFPALIPVVSVEYQRVGVNFAIVPSYKDRLHGALTIQLKFKLKD
ncbi:hypothetical protein [Pseudoduganella albidiflava]|uniref:Phenol degradation protein meta n=1 Tax=Pseudoduganella albidiflava TaxID=321983 RepID=A0A411WYC6_9BURK|nr:hypothetical protein [Pseudoduganella albidiflava]QBI01692.1 hypothetical protein EYF70_13165 [Pseudoduganella albidiflava]GGY40423.1 hypothetical protein GCM10007387_23280 [Pseudoduganella albidiflava]